MKFYNVFLTSICVFSTIVIQGMESESWHYQKKNRGFFNSCMMPQQQYNHEYPCFDIQEKELSSFWDILLWSCSIKDRLLVPDVTNKVLRINYCLSMSNGNRALVNILSQSYGISSVQYHCLDNKHKKTLMYISLGIQDAAHVQEPFCLKAEGVDRETSKTIYKHMFNLPIEIRKKIAAKDGNCVFLQKNQPSLYNICLGQGNQRASKRECLSNVLASTSYCVTTGACFTALGYLLNLSKPTKKIGALAGGTTLAFVGGCFWILGGCMSLSIERSKYFSLIALGALCGWECAEGCAQIKGRTVSRPEIAIAMTAGGLIGNNLLKPGAYVSDCVTSGFSESHIQSMIASGFKCKFLILENEI